MRSADLTKNSLLRKRRDEPSSQTPGRFAVLRQSVISSGRKLRMYSGKHVDVFGSILPLDRRVSKDASLELWYGGRVDPGPEAIKLLLAA